jgi:hypothetical protein
VNWSNHVSHVAHHTFNTCRLLPTPWNVIKKHHIIFILAPLVFCGVDLFDYPHCYEVNNFIWDKLLGVSFLKPSVTTHSFVILSSMHFDKKNILAKVEFLVQNSILKLYSLCFYDPLITLINCLI